MRNLFRKTPLGVDLESYFLENCKIPGCPNSSEIKARKADLRGAIGRYRRAKIRVPKDWIDELQKYSS